MSRIGKKQIILDSNIKINIQNQIVEAKGPKGKLRIVLSPEIGIEQSYNTIQIYQKVHNKYSKKLYGISRTLINNMIIGVSKGFYKILEIHGVGYRAQVSHNILTLNVGYSHPIDIKPDDNIKIDVENNTIIKIFGIDKTIVGQVAATIRSIRPPEPYKGKGIRYQNEIIRRKIGKAGK